MTRNWNAYWANYLEEKLQDPLSRTKPALLILHGLFGSGSNWASFAKEWGGAWTVLTPDLPGHGVPGSTADLAYPRLADLLAEGLRAVGLDNLTVLGHSMGGKAGLALALRHPASLRRLVVADIAPRAYGPHHDKVFAALDAVSLETLGSRTEALASFSTHVDDPMVQGFFMKNLLSPERTQDLGWRWRFDLETLRAAYGHILDWPLAESTLEHHIDFLLVEGARSGYVEEADRATYRRMAPRGRVVSLDAGHWLQVERRQEFAQACEAFFNERL